MESDTEIGKNLKNSLKELVNFLFQKCVNKKTVQSKPISKFLQEVDDVCLALVNHCQFPLELYLVMKKRTRRDRFVISCPLVEFECTSNDCQEEATIKAVFTDPDETDPNIFYICKNHYFIVHNLYSLLHMTSNMAENISNRILHADRIFCSASVQFSEDSEFNIDDFDVNKNIINSLVDYYYGIFLCLGKPQKKQYCTILKEFLNKNDFFDVWKRPETILTRKFRFTNNGKRKKIGQITPKKFLPF